MEETDDINIRNVLKAFSGYSTYGLSLSNFREKRIFSGINDGTERSRELLAIINLLLNTGCLERNPNFGDYKCLITKKGCEHLQLLEWNLMKRPESS